MEGERGSNVLKPKGCIKTTKGPWAVRRGGHVMRYRFPSEQERLNNKQREKLRRSVRRNIFKGLKTHGNYPLPTHADSNDLLKALCDEAGWHVEDDGTIYRKQERDVGKMPTLVDEDDEEDFCKCGDGNEAEEVDTTLAL